MAALRRTQAASTHRIPLWLKWIYTGVVCVWAVGYAHQYGPWNFLWFCDLANFAIAFALWFESPLLLSSQAVSVLLVQIAWVVDVSGRLLTGSHPIGGTEYMFDASLPLLLRLASLFHVATPPLLVWGVARLGYHRRGWLLQTAISSVVLPACFWLTAPAANINWVFGPLGQQQSRLEPELYLVVAMAGYPLILYLPTHLMLRKLFPGMR